MASRLREVERQSHTNDTSRVLSAISVRTRRPVLYDQLLDAAERNDTTALSAVCAQFVEHVRTLPTHEHAAAAAAFESAIDAVHSDAALDVLATHSEGFMDILRKFGSSLKKKLYKKIIKKRYDQLANEVGSLKADVLKLPAETPEHFIKETSLEYRTLELEKLENALKA